MKSWAVSCRLVAASDQVRERMQLRMKEDKTWLVFSWVREHMCLLMPLQLRREESGPATMQTSLTYCIIIFFRDSGACKMLDFFFPRCEAKPHDRVAHLGFVRLAVVEQ